MNSMTTIRPIIDDDWPAVWRVIEPVFRAGETYPCPMDVSEADARRYWIEQPTATFVAVDDCGDIVGTYYIRPNQPGLGDHVCNCGYIVAEHARGRGVGAAMCEHSQHQARSRGFRAMQFNLVVATNEASYRLWRKHGFEVVGPLPLAFRHPRLGLVDAYVMYKLL